MCTGVNYMLVFKVTGSFTKIQNREKMLTLPLWVVTWLEVTRGSTAAWSLSNPRWCSGWSNCCSKVATVRYILYSLTFLQTLKMCINGVEPIFFSTSTLYFAEHAQNKTKQTNKKTCWGWSFRKDQPQQETENFFPRLHQVPHVQTLKEQRILPVLHAYRRLPAWVQLDLHHEDQPACESWEREHIWEAPTSHTYLISTFSTFICTQTHTQTCPCAFSHIAIPVRLFPFAEKCWVIISCVLLWSTGSWGPAPDSKVAMRPEHMETVVCTGGTDRKSVV